jgi:tyrosyl-DNA phosphodiesterase-1
VDLEWLFDTFPILQNVPIFLVHGEHETPVIRKVCDVKLVCVSHLPQEMPPFALPHFRLHRPQLPLQYGCCHGKIFLLYYATHLRFILSTANLLQIDYERKTQVLAFLLLLLLLLKLQ